MCSGSVGEEFGRGLAGLCRLRAVSRRAVSTHAGHPKADRGWGSACSTIPSHGGLIGPIGRGPQVPTLGLLHSQARQRLPPGPEIRARRGGSAYCLTHLGARAASTTVSCEPRSGDGELDVTFSGDHCGHILKPQEPRSFRDVSSSGGTEVRPPSPRTEVTPVR